MRKVKVRVMKEDHIRLLGSKMELNDGIIPRSTEIIAFTDTCAQTCISDPSILSYLDITESNLIPTKHKIIIVTADPLKVNGVVLV